VIAQNFERCIQFEREKEDGYTILFHPTNMTVYGPDPEPINRRPKSEFLISAVKILKFCHVDKIQAKKSVF